MKNLFLFSLCLLIFSCADTAPLEEKIKTLEDQLQEAETQLNTAKNKLEYVTSPGMTHSVFFWLKEDLSDENKAAFLEGVKSLRGIKSVGTLHIGPPAPTEERGVVDNSYSYALLIDFENVEAQNAYQVDPIHLKFVEDHKDKWTKVIVYDNMNTE